MAYFLTQRMFTKKTEVEDPVGMWYCGAICAWIT